MNTLIFVVAVGLAMIVLLFYAASRSGSQKRTRRIQKLSSAERSVERATTQWRAVKIAPGLDCCEEASNLADKVFLASASPHLPLEGCGQTDCNCRYVHLEDRRSGGDRRVELGELDAFLPANQVERRQVAGRRNTDLAA